MASERRGLLVLFEGFPPTVIRSQVVTLAGWLAQQGIVRLDILSVACSRAVHEQALAALPSIADAVQRSDREARVTLLRGLRPVLPGATTWNRRLLDSYLAAAGPRYRVVHARTDYAAFIAAPVVARRELRLVWDCRGDAVAEFLSRTGDADGARGPIRRRRATVISSYAHRAAEGCQAAMFVTHALRDRFAKHVRGPSQVIPTVADARRFHFDPVLRGRVRAELGYTPGQPVCVFAGTLAAYQGFAEAVRWFEALASRKPAARLLVVTPALDEARRLLSGIDPVLWSVRRVAFDDMNKMLNAADCAFLTRPRSAVNVAAFPTKFAEYGLAGLPVVMSDATPDCTVHARRAGNLVPMDADGGAFDPPNVNRRAAVSDYFRREMTRERFVDAYREVYG